MKRICSVILIVALSSAAYGHSTEHPEMNKWLGELRAKNGSLCCSGEDGTAVADADWESVDGKYRVFVEGAWYTVSDTAVVTEPNKFGRTMVWPYKSISGIIIRCFMPGPMT
jgi:hypothetical protein